MRRAVLFSCGLVVALFLLGCALDHRPVEKAADYEHDKWDTQPRDILRNFRAFVVSFDSEDDNDEDGKGEASGGPPDRSPYAGAFCLPAVISSVSHSDTQLASTPKWKRGDGDEARNARRLAAISGQLQGV